MNVNDLRTYFTGKTLPTDHFTISKWETTNNLANLVSMALERAEGGNRNSLEVLNRIHDKLEGPATVVIPTMIIEPTELPPNVVI